MGQTRNAITQNLAEPLCWEVARRDDSRAARRLYRKQLVDGMYRLDEGALLDDFFHFLQAIGVIGLLEEAHGATIHRRMLPFVQYVLLYGLKTLFGIESIHVLPNLLFRTGCDVSKRTCRVSRWAGSTGAASSWKRPETILSSLPGTATASFIGPSTRCCWGSG